MDLMITMHWVWFALMFGFSLVGVVALGLQLLFCYWARTGQYERFDKVR